MKGRGGAAGERNHAPQFNPSSTAESWEGVALSTQPLQKQLSRAHSQLKETAVPGRRSLATHPWGKESVLDRRGPSQMEKI